MKLPVRRPARTALPGHVGQVRVRRLGEVSRQVQPGDILVIDVRDVDALTGRAIRDCKPALVVNRATFISGRVPNLGPAILAQAGIALIEVDGMGPLRDGATVRVDGATLYGEDDEVLAEGHLVTPDEVAERADSARVEVGAHLSSFVHNATELLRREESVLLHGTGVPTLRTRVSGRAAVVVSGDATTADLKHLRRFLREQVPVLIAVDAGAALLTTRRLRADVLVLSEAAVSGSVVAPEIIQRARDVVVPTSHEGGSAAIERLQRNSVMAEQFVTATAPYDAALLLARHNGASLVIPVGRPPALDDLVDGSRSGQASAFVTRMALGKSMVDSDAVPRLYAGRTPGWLLLLLLLAGLVAVGVAVATTPLGQEWWGHVHTALSALLPKKDRP